MRPPPLRIRHDPGWHMRTFYSVFWALQTKPNPNFPFSIKKLPVSNGQEVARRRMSLKYEHPAFSMGCDPVWHPTPPKLGSLQHLVLKCDLFFRSNSRRPPQSPAPSSSSAIFAQRMISASRRIPGRHAGRAKTPDAKPDAKPTPRYPSFPDSCLTKDCLEKSVSPALRRD